MSDQPPTTTIIQPPQQAKRGTSCFNCKKAHSKCDGQIPCSQCTKKGKICIPTSSSSNNKNDGGGGGSSDDNEVITPKNTKKKTIVMASSSKTKSSAAKKSKSTASDATASRSIVSYFSKNGNNDNNNTNNDGSVDDNKENNEDNDNDDNKKKKNRVVVKNEQVEEAEDEEGESTPTRSSKRRAAKRKLVYSELVSSSEEEAEDDENDNDEGGKKKKKKKVIKTPTKKTSSSAAKKRRKKSDDDGDEDFVISVRDDDEDEDEYMDDDRNQVVKEEEENEEADDDENDDDDDDEEFATPSKRASSSKKRGEATPRSLSSSNISATPTRATPKTVTKVVKSAQKKTPARAMKLVKAPIPKRPGKELANSDGVVTQGLRTFFVNKSRVVKGKKKLIHYETTDISMLCPVPNLLPIITHNEQLSLLDESHPQYCTTLYVDKNPASVDFLSKKPSNTGSLNRDAVMYNIKIGQSASIKNDSCLLLNVGGGSSVWCMDWCRRDTNSEQYAVFACHPQHKPYVRIDEFYSGPENESEAFPLDNMIQIWSFGDCVGSNQSATDHSEPRCVTCIKHNHGFAWDCKWLPITVMNLTDNEVLGVLAVAFSDGALVIYTVPKLNHPPLGKVNCVTLDESQLYTCSHGKDEKKLFTALGWSLDGRFLASGCSDGNLIIWKVDLLAARDGSTLKKMAHVRGHFHRKHGGRVRSISWSSVDINVFATCGDDGNTRYWDIRDIFEPHCSNLVSRQWATDVCYPTNTTGCISVSSDGQVKQFDARENNFTCVRAHAHPLWSVSVMSTRAAFAYSSADGSVMLSSLEEDSIAKKPKGAVKERFDSVIFSSCLVQEKSARDSGQVENNSSGKHICVSLPMNNKADKKKVSDESARQVTDLLQQKQEDLVSDGIELTPSSSKKKGKKKATPKEGSVRIIPDHSLSIFSVRFHHSRHKSLRNWCILGGQAGYVCAMRVPDELEV